MYMHVPMYRETFKNRKWDWKDDSVGKGPTWIWSPSMYKCKRRFKIEARILPFPTHSLWQGLNQTQSSMIGASIPRQIAQSIPCLCLLRLESWVGQPPLYFHGFWWPELWSSYLCSKCFDHWAISLVRNPLFLCYLNM